MALPPTDTPYAIVPVHLSRGEVKEFYHGFANSTLWPLFHGFPTRARFDRAGWDAYGRVNRRFAEAAAGVAGDGELVWVHDYQLMLSPLYLRDRTPAARLAFFLHIPFPPFDLFRLLPWDRELLRGLLASDLIGFHSQGYVRNFLDCVERLLGVRIDRDAQLIEHGGRTVRVGAFPLGIDFDLYDTRARARRRRPTRPTARVVLGVDRLDYTKGIPERIRAFERLLELHPQHRERVVLLQLAVPEPRRGARVPASEARDRRAGRARQRPLRHAAAGRRFTTCTAAPRRSTWWRCTATRTSRWSRRCATA